MVQDTRPEISAQPRETLGKKVKQLRRQGLIPANIFGRRAESRAIQIPSDDVLRLLRTAERNQIIYLLIDGEEPRPTFIKDIQRKPTTDAILHMDFQQISLLEKVRMEVPLLLVGQAPGVDTLGGTLIHTLDTVTVEALPTDIPLHIEVDVSGLAEIDQTLHVRDLTLSDKVTVLTEPDVVVAKVAPPTLQVAPAAEAVREEAAAEEAGEAS